MKYSLITVKIMFSNSPRTAAQVIVHAPTINYLRNYSLIVLYTAKIVWETWTAVHVGSHLAVHVSTTEGSNSEVICMPKGDFIYIHDTYLRIVSS